MRMDLTRDGCPPRGPGVWLRWTAMTKSGVPCNSRVQVMAEENVSLADVMLRLDARLRKDGLEQIAITLG